jgi:hypothetical protein
MGTGIEDKQEACVKKAFRQGLELTRDRFSWAALWHGYAQFWCVHKVCDRELGVAASRVEQGVGNKVAKLVTFLSDCVTARSEKGLRLDAGL